MEKRRRTISKCRLCGFYQNPHKAIFSAAGRSQSLASSLSFFCAFQSQTSCSLNLLHHQGDKRADHQNARAAAISLKVKGERKQLIKLMHERLPLPVRRSAAPPLTRVTGKRHIVCQPKFGWQLWKRNGYICVYFYWPPGPNPVVTISTRVGPGSRLPPGPNPVVTISTRVGPGSRLLFRGTHFLDIFVCFFFSRHRLKLMRALDEEHK